MIFKLTVQQIVQSMVLARLHLGHKRRSRNPKMMPYIYTEKDGLQIIDLFQTYWYLKKACLLLFQKCRRGQRVLFVGTGIASSKCVEEIATACHSWYINKRWLGGLLTNWQTLRKSILKLQPTISKNKKEASRKERQQKRLLKYLGGIQTRSEKDVPDIVIVIGQQKEMNAIRECQKLQIPILTILDTDCDPTLTDYFIPANDDSLSSVHFILKKLSEAIQAGQKAYAKDQENLKKKKHKTYTQRARRSNNSRSRKYKGKTSKLVSSKARFKSDIETSKNQKKYQ